MTAPASIVLHIERLVIDGGLLEDGGERELRHALAGELERMLPDAASAPGALHGVTGPRAAEPVVAGGPPVPAAGLAGRIARGVQAAVGEALWSRRSPARELHPAGRAPAPRPTLSRPSAYPAPAGAAEDDSGSSGRPSDRAAYVSSPQAGEAQGSPLPRKP